MQDTKKSTQKAMEQTTEYRVLVRPEDEVNLAGTVLDLLIKSFIANEVNCQLEKL